MQGLRDERSHAVPAQVIQRHRPQQCQVVEIAHPVANIQGEPFLPVEPVGATMFGVEVQVQQFAEANGCLIHDASSRSPLRKSSTTATSHSSWPRKKWLSSCRSISRLGAGSPSNQSRNVTASVAKSSSDAMTNLGRPIVRNAE